MLHPPLPPGSRAETALLGRHEPPAEGKDDAAKRAVFARLANLQCAQGAM